MGKHRHAIEHTVDVRDNVPTVHDQGHVPRTAECGVHNGSVLRHIDVLTIEHRLTSGKDPLLLGKTQQGRKHISRDALLAEIHQQPGTGPTQRRGALGILSEEITQKTLAHGTRKVGELAPGRRIGGIRGFRRVHVGSLALA